MIFYIFRHGQTNWNAEARIQGHTDIALNEIGRSEARLLGEKLKTFGIEHVFSSDLKRALETAHIALDGIPIESTDQLREANFGEAEGKLFKDVLVEYGEDYFKTAPKYWDLRLAGGETKRECIDRVWNYINEISKSRRFEKLGISTHGGVIRNIVHSLLPPESEKIAIPNCCIYQISLSEGKWVLDGQL